MNVNQFIKDNNLKPADAIVVKKVPLGILDHYLIYIGFDGEHKFIANYTQGTKILRNKELVLFAQEFVPDRIRRFKGNLIQRNAALNRALTRMDHGSYHLLLNNCEHYANYVQSGNEYSRQTNVFGTGMIIAGLVAATNKNSQGVGLFAAAIGLMTLLLDDNKPKK